MTTFKQKITSITGGTLGTDYKMADDAIFFISGTTTITVGSDNVNALYYVVGGGGGGSKGNVNSSNTRVVGRGGGGGGVETGRINLIGGKTYTITVGAGGNGQNTANALAGNGNASSITCNNTTPAVNIVANGGKNTGADAETGASTGQGVTYDVSDTNTDSPDSGTPKGNGGISVNIGGRAGQPRIGTTDASGTHSPSIGGGGGGGYGLSGNGGNGGKGAVILILTDNSNKIKYIEKQLREMNHLPGTMVDQYNQQYNTTMMAGALWTVLATSLVYYVFTRV
jgi:hypothetical protein